MNKKLVVAIFLIVLLGLLKIEVVPVFAQEPPAAPSDLFLTPLSESQIELIWTDNSNNESGFRIERHAEGEEYQEIAVTGPDVWIYEDTGLHHNTWYYYRVRAYNAYGTSDYCPEQSAQTWNVVPAAPLNLVATAISDSVIDLTWIDTSDNEDNFVIERKEEGGSYAEVLWPAANETNCQDIGLIYNTTYYYRVKARNSVGDSDYSNEDSATTFNIGPNAPSGLYAYIISDTRINLVWKDNSDNELGFKIERKEWETGTYLEIGITGMNEATFSDSGLAPDITYYYRVRAYNELGNSNYSNEDSVTTAAPVAPSDLNATPVSYNAIDLVWTDNSNNETGFRIYRKMWETGTYLEIGYVGEDITAFSDSGLSANTIYYYKVLAYNPIGNSPFSSEDSATTFDTIPIAPSGLIASFVSETIINLVWTDNSNNESGFKIERKEWETGTYTEIGAADANILTYSDSGLVPNTIYYYRVFAYNLVGNSDYSNEDSASTFDTIPLPPSGLDATAVSYNAIDLVWTDNSNNELGFRIYRKMWETGTYIEIGTVSADVSAFSDSGLSANTIYYYKVLAYNPVGNSEYSNEDSATTFDTIPLAPSDLFATSIFDTAIVLVWTDNSGNEQGFRIERKTEEETYQEIATTDTDVAMFYDSGLTPNTLYYYRVRAYNLIGNSEYSNEYSATTLRSSISETTSFLSISNSIFAADGYSKCTVTVTVKSDTGIPLAGKWVTICTSRGTSYDTITQLSPATDASGQCTATVVSGYPGACNIFAVSTGCTIYENLILNPSFEEDTSGWDMNVATINNDPGYVYDGAKSLQLNANNANVDGAYTSYYIPITNNSLSVYQVSAYIKANIITGNYYFSIFYYDNAGSPCSPDHSDLAYLDGSSPGWVRVSRTCGGSGSGAEIIFPSNCVKVKIRASCWWNASGNPSGQGWTDAIRFKRIPSVNIYPLATKLKITSSPFKIPAGSISQTIKVEAQDTDGYKAWNFSGTITLFSSSVSGRFSVNKYNWIDTSIVYLSAGSVSFYYKDTEIGNPTITVFRQGLTPDTQIEEIEEAVPSGTFSYIILSNGIAKANGLNSITLVVTVCNSGGYVLSGKTVTLYTGRGESYTAISANPQVTDLEGRCMFTISSFYVGIDTITAVCEGESISRPAGSGLVGGYLFDKSDVSLIEDASSSGNYGTFYGTIYETTSTVGRRGRALWFDGSSNYVSIPDASSLDLVNAATIMLWIKASGKNGQWQNMVKKWETEVRNYGVYLALDNGNFAFSASYVGSPNPFNDVSSGWSAWDNKWHHLAAVFDGSTQRVKLYADGDTKQNFFIGYSEFKTNNVPLIIGDVTPGIIDEVKVCNRALGWQEIYSDFLGLCRVEFIPSVPTRLRIVSPPLTLSRNAPSIKIMVEAQDSDGDRCNFYDTFVLSSSSPGGAFSISPDPWVDTTTISLSAGSAYFYYKDSMLGNPVITVYHPSLEGDTQEEKIVEGTVSSANSELKYSPSSVKATGIDSIIATVTVRDKDGNALSGKYVSLCTERGLPYTSIDVNPQITDAYGKCTFKITSAYAGNETLSAVCEGKTISVIIPLDLAGGYLFNEGSTSIISDISTYANNGTFAGTVYDTTVTDGKYGKALWFDGSSNYVTIPDASSLDLPDAVTILLWIKAGGSNGLFQDVVKKWGADRNYGIYLAQNNGQFHFSASYVGSPNSFDDIGSGWSAWDNKWHHLAAVFDGSTQRVKLYVDGDTKQEYFIGYSRLKTNDAPLIIGGNTPGIIDDVKIYSRALSHKEIVDDYNTAFSGLPVVSFTASRLAITSPPFKVRAGFPSPKITVAASGEIGGVDVSINDTVIVSSSSESRSFSVDKKARYWGSTGSDTIIYLTRGEGFFYYKDYKGGKPVLTVSNSALGLVPAEQTETVGPYSISFITPQFIIHNSIRDSACFALIANTYSGETETLFDETVTLTSSSGKGRFSLSNTLWQDITLSRFSSGILTVYYSDRKGGNPTITVYQPEMDLLATQKETITMPIPVVTKEQKNLGTGERGTLNVIRQGDTIEYTLNISNAGAETMTEVVITDLELFDTRGYSPVAFISIDTQFAGAPVDSWTYTAGDTVTWKPWNSVPSPEEDIKGLRWFVNILPPGESRSVRFRVRVK